MKKSSRDIPKCNNPCSGHENMSYLTNIANWYKLGYKPPEMEKVIFTLVTFKFFQLLLCNKHKIYCSLSFEHLKILYNELIQDHNFVLAISFLWSFPLAGNTLPLIPNIACLFLDWSLEEKKELNKLISLQCSMTCLIIQFPWLAAKGYKNNTNWNYSCFISPSELQSPIFFLLINCCI